MENITAPDASTLLQRHGFDLTSLIKSPFPNARPLIAELIAKDMINGHMNPSEIVEWLIRQEGDSEAVTRDNITVRKTVNPDGSITIQAGDDEENQAEAVRRPGDLTSIGLYIHTVVEAVRTKLAERTD